MTQSASGPALTVRRLSARTRWPLTRTCDDPGAVLKWFEVGGVIDHLRGIEDDDVGDIGPA